MKIFKALVVDDEKFSRFDLIQQLQKNANIEIASEAENLEQARKILQSTKIDLIFLDIQMPGEIGFDLLPDISSDIKVIFVTAYDQYAIRAFEVNALDYLLKPVNPDRLKVALDKLENLNKKSNIDIKKLQFDDCLFYKGINTYEFLRISNIAHINSAGDYTEIFTIDKDKILMHKTLKEWEERLPEQYFVRIHREHIINIDRVNKIMKWNNQTYQIFLKEHDNPLTMSRKYFSKIKKLMN